jgi:CubicO group peptidase (beta-lactamase class C family)
MSYRIITIFISSFICAFATAQSKTEKELFASYDSMLNKLFKAGNPGGTAIVSLKGEVIYKKAFGMADMELNVPMQTEMVFRIGSITKQFTAIAILQLAEQGKLSLQDDIKKFIPDYPAHGKTITIEHLLTHTSGIKNYTSMESFGELLRRDMKPEELIDSFKNKPMDFAPGEKWSYNNSGYFLLGFIIEKLSGKTYEQYINEHLFIPAGMNNSAYDNPNRIIKNRVKGYQRSNEGFENADYISMTLPYSAGALIATVEDLAKWNKAVNSYKLVSKKWLDKAYTDFKLNNGRSARFGYGWLITELQGSRSFDHGGAINGFLSEALYLPVEDVYIAILSNCTCNSPEEPLIKMAALTIGKPYVLGDIGLDSILAKDYEGIYENADGKKQIIRAAGNNLTSQRDGGDIDSIIRFDKDKFFFKTNDLHTIHFTRNASGKVEKLQFKSRLEISEWIKVNK